MKLSVVLGSYDRCNLLKLCIEALRKELQDIEHEIIVVDGGSTDGALEWLTAQRDIITICQHNRGEWRGKPLRRRSWGYFMNLGFKCAQGEYICMVSDDSLIVPNAVLNGLALFDKKRDAGENLGALAFYFRDYPVRKKFAVAINVGNLYVNHGLYLNKAMQDAGYISEDEYHFYFADTDLCLKIRQKGYTCEVSPNSFVEHYFEATPEIRNSNNDEKKDKDRQHLVDKWAGIAYPAQDQEKYTKLVGYWDFIDVEDVDDGKTIEQLIKASEESA